MESNLRVLWMLLIFSLGTVESRGQAAATKASFHRAESGASGVSGPVPDPGFVDPQTSHMTLLEKAAIGTILFVVIEGGILIYSGAFAYHPASGAAFMAVSGLVAAANANGPTGSKITFMMAGGMIAYNLIRFGVEKPGEDRSVRIFTENFIVMNAAVLGGILYSSLIPGKAPASQGNSLALYASPSGIGIAKAWDF